MILTEFYKGIFHISSVVLLILETLFQDMVYTGWPFKITCRSNHSPLATSGTPSLSYVVKFKLAVYMSPNVEVDLEIWGNTFSLNSNFSITNPEIIQGGAGVWQEEGGRRK